MQPHKLTDWFPGHIKPVRPGPYNTDADDFCPYQYWNGEYWGGYAPSVSSACESASLNYRSMVQSPRWRGLAFDPSHTDEQTDEQTDDSTGIVEVSE